MCVEGISSRKNRWSIRFALFKVLIRKGRGAKEQEKERVRRRAERRKTGGGKKSKGDGKDAIDSSASKPSIR